MRIVTRKRNECDVQVLLPFGADHVTKLSHRRSASNFLAGDFTWHSPRQRLLRVESVQSAESLMAPKALNEGIAKPSKRKVSRDDDDDDESAEGSDVEVGGREAQTSLRQCDADIIWGLTACPVRPPK